MFCATICWSWRIKQFCAKTCWSRHIKHSSSLLFTWLIQSTCLYCCCLRAARLDVGGGGARRQQQYKHLDWISQVNNKLDWLLYAFWQGFLGFGDVFWMIWECFLGDLVMISGWVGNVFWMIWQCFLDDFFNRLTSLRDDECCAKRCSSSATCPCWWSHRSAASSRRETTLREWRSITKGSHAK